MCGNRLSLPLAQAQPEFSLFCPLVLVLKRLEGAPHPSTLYTHSFPIALENFRIPNYSPEYQNVLSRVKSGRLGSRCLRNDPGLGPSSRYCLRKLPVFTGNHTPLPPLHSASAPPEERRSLGERS